MDRRVSESGGVGVPLEYYWKEFNSFEERDDDEEDCSKTPDEGEIEEEWLREAGFENLVDSELTEQDQAELYEDILATLTTRQIAVVQKRLDTVRRSKKRRLPRTRHRADVREVFNSPPPSLSSIHTGPLSLGFCNSHETIHSNGGERRKPPSTPLKTFEGPIFPPPVKSNRALPPLPFLRTGHTGGFSLRDHSKGIDCESPSSVEVLRYESRRSVQERDNSSLNSFSSEPSEPFSLETGFQEISSRLNSVSDMDLEKDLTVLQSNSNTQIGDLGETDRNLVRSLAIIEVAALLDTHGLVPTRRRKPNRKKGKDSIVFGASLNSLLEIDKRRCPGLKVPLIFQWILYHLHNNGLREEGLMRLAGSVQKVQVLKVEIEKNYVTSPILVENLIRQSSVHDVSVLLKQLVRHLSEPLLTNSHMDSFLQVPNIPNTQDQINILNLLTLALPDSHREFLQELLYFLAKVVEDEDVNRMSLGNVAMIMAPNLFPPPRLKKGNLKQNDLAAEVTVAAMSSKTTQLLIKYSQMVGAVPSNLLAQARLQIRRSTNKNAKRMGRKYKGDKQKNQKDEHTSSCVIRVQMSCLRHPNNVPVTVTEKSTAGEVVERVAETLDHLVNPRHNTATSEQQENKAFTQRPRTISEPLVMKHRCLMGTKKNGENLKDHYLYFIRENVGERRLDHNTNILNISGSGTSLFSTGSAWEIRCHH